MRSCDLWDMPSLEQHLPALRADVLTAKHAAVLESVLGLAPECGGWMCFVDSFLALLADYAHGLPLYSDTTYRMYLHELIAPATVRLEPVVA